jgi:hypothetical protein
MGIGRKSSRVEELRALAGALGVEPSSADLEAALGFLDRILPELARLEALLAVEEGPGAAGDGGGGVSLRPETGP